MLILSKNAGFTAIYRKAFGSRYCDTPKVIDRIWQQQRLREFQRPKIQRLKYRWSRGTVYCTHTSCPLANGSLF